MYLTNRTSWIKHLDFMILDLLCLVSSFILANYIRFNTLDKIYFNDYVYRNILLILILLNIVFVFFYEPYKNVLKRGRLKEIRITFNFDSFIFLGVILYMYLFKISSLSSRLVVGYTYVLYFISSYFTRLLLKKYIRKKSYNSIKNGDRSLLIMTNKRNVKKNIENITNNNFDMYYIKGLCILDKDMQDETIEGYPVVANRDNVLDWISNQWVDDVFFGMNLNDTPDDLIEGLASAGISIHNVISQDYVIEGYSQSVNKIGSYTVLSSVNKTYTNRQIITKRLMDIVGGLIGCFLTLIIAIIIGPIIYIKSPGPIFYGSERIGLNGRHFKMYKFRSMIPNAEAMKEDLQAQNIVKDGMMFKIKDDPRVIPGIGTFIRKTSLDEFPQFFNVLKGEMSLVGTRPPTVDEWNKYKLEHRMRMTIKPGVTGLWQISGRSSITDFDEVLKLDKQYIDNWDLALDIKIIFKTILYLFEKHDDAM